MNAYLLSMFRTSPCLGAGLEPGGFLPGSLGGSWAACSGASGGRAAFTAGRLKKLSYRVSTRGLYTVAGAAAPFAGAPELVRAPAEDLSLSSLAICTEREGQVEEWVHGNRAHVSSPYMYMGSHMTAQSNSSVTISVSFYLAGHYHQPSILWYIPAPSDRSRA